MAAAKGIFITATDTDIGKTFFTARLARLLRDAGLDTGIAKPVQSGYPVDDPRCDSAILKRISGVSDTEKEICPFTFKAALTPWLAAKLEGHELKFDDLLAAVHAVSRKHQYTLVEGAGGLYAPLTADAMVLDLIKALKMPVILLAHAGLGTINHCLLSLQALRSAGVPISGIILNQCDPEMKAISRLEDLGPEAEASNPLLLTHFGKVKILGRIPKLQADDLDISPYIETDTIKTILEDL